MEPWSHGAMGQQTHAVVACSSCSLVPTSDPHLNDLLVRICEPNVGSVPWSPNQKGLDLSWVYARAPWFPLPSLVKSRFHDGDEVDGIPGPEKGFFSRVLLCRGWTIASCNRSDVRSSRHPAPRPNHGAEPVPPHLGKGPWVEEKCKRGRVLHVWRRISI